MTGFTRPRGGGVCQNRADIDVWGGSVSVSLDGRRHRSARNEDIDGPFKEHGALGIALSGTITALTPTTGGTTTMPITARSVLNESPVSYSMIVGAVAFSE